MKRKTIEQNVVVSNEYVAEKPLYIPARRVRKAARRIARTNKFALASIILVIILLIMFLIAYCQENMGNFTINLNRVDMYRRGISLSSTSDFKEPTSRLTVKTISRVTNISQSELPEGLNKLEGDISGKDYIAYAFFLRNGGIEDIDYKVNIKLDKKAKGAEKALRVSVYLDDELTVYAYPKDDGTPEDGTKPFVDSQTVMDEVVTDFNVGDIHKYTVIVWLDGDDADCTDDIIGGMVKCSMNFDTGESSDVSLWDLIKNLPIFS